MPEVGNSSHIKKKIFSCFIWQEGMSPLIQSVFPVGELQAFDTYTSCALLLPDFQEK